MATTANCRKAGYTFAIIFTFLILLVCNIEEVHILALMYGLIAPYAEGFRDSCNRLRVSSTGDLHTCLFGNEGYPMRQYLESDSQIGI